MAQLSAKPIYKGEILKSGDATSALSTLLGISGNMSTQRGACETNRTDVWGDSETKRTSLKFTTKSVVETKNTREESAPTKDLFSPDQTDAILDDLRTFAKPDGLQITNCIFRTDHVEICYVFNGSSDHNKDELRQQLADHMKINSQLMKMTKLRTKPIYKETTLAPGETASILPQGNCKIGAFVEVEGKGNHALMSGHGKNNGAELFYPNRHRLGVINVSLQPPFQPTLSDNLCYTDIALARLENQAGYIAQVLDDIHGTLRLMEQPIYATNNMMVKRFTENARKGRVDSAAYNIVDPTYNIAFRLLSVVSEDGGAIHDEGDSGILIATDTPVNGKVNAVGMLVRLEQMELDDEEQTRRVTSLAVPLCANFGALCSHSYCNGATIKFLN